MKSYAFCVVETSLLTHRTPLYFSFSLFSITDGSPSNGELAPGSDSIVAGFKSRHISHGLTAERIAAVAMNTNKPQPPPHVFLSSHNVFRPCCGATAALPPLWLAADLTSRLASQRCSKGGRFPKLTSPLPDYIKRRRKMKYVFL